MEEIELQKTPPKKRKKTKRFFLSLSIIILVIVLLIGFSPLIIQSYINSEDGAKKMSEIASEYLNADIKVGKINLKLIDNLPNIDISIENVDVVSNVFHKEPIDTLLHFNNFNLSVNAIEYIKNNVVIVNKLEIIEPRINAYVDSSGKANWEIYESDTTKEDTSSLSLPKIYINSVNLEKINIKYKDELLGINTSVDSAFIKTNGIISDSLYSIFAAFKISAIDYSDSDIEIKNIPISIETSLQTNNDFTSINIDSLKLFSNETLNLYTKGYLHQETDKWNTDINFNLNIDDLQKVLDIVPKSLLKDIPKIELSGSFLAKGNINGVYNDSIYPTVKADLVCNNVIAKMIEENATIKLDLKTDILYNSQNGKESFINITKLDASVGETYLTMTGKAKNIIENADINAKLKCNINLNYLSTIFPLEDIKYRGQFSSDIETKFKLDDLLKFDLRKIYMLGKVNVKSIFLRIPSIKLFLLSENTNADIGINSIQSKRSGVTHLCNTKIDMDTLRLVYQRMITATISKLHLSANANEFDDGEVPKLRVSGRFNNIQTIVNDTMFLKGKAGKLSLSVAQDTTDTFIPRLKLKLNLDSVTYYEPTAGIFLDSARFEMTGKPRIRKYRRINGERIAIDQSTRTSIDLDSLISICSVVNDAETALKAFKFEGKMYMKVMRYTSPYLPLRTVARRLDMTFTDDTVTLNNIKLRLGKSQVSINGKVNNLRRAFLRGRTLSSDINIKSKRIDLNEVFYALYQGDLEREKDIAAKKNITIDYNAIRQRERDSINQLPDSLKAKARSERRSRNSDLSKVYENRMKKMSDLMEKAYNEETSNENDVANSDSIDYDTVPMSLIKIPANFDFKVKINLDTIKFAGMKMESFNGDLIAKNSTLQIKNLQTKSNIGDLNLNMMYHCDNTDIAQAGIDLLGTNIEVEKLLDAIPMIDSIFPMLSSFEGKLDCELSAISDLNAQMEPILPSINAACYMNGKNLVLLDGETFGEIAKMLLFKKKTKNVIDQMSVEITISDNKMDFLPFTLSMDKYKVAVSGEMDLDFKYYYHISVLKSPIIFDFGIDVIGNIDDFDFKLVKPKYKDEKSIAQTVSLTNQSGKGRQSLQRTLQKMIQDAIDTYSKENKTDF